MSQFFKWFLVAITVAMLTACDPVSNTAPVATPQSVTVAEDSTDNAITLAGTDADGDTISSFTVVTNPTHGTLGGTAPNVTYTPTTGYAGSDSFTFKVNDGTEDSENNATVSITVTAAGASNTAPVATPQSVTVAEDSTDNTITLAGTDADGDTISSFTVVTNPTHGTLGGTAPNVTYTPTANYNGADSFTFKVNDGTDDSENNATVSITVTAAGASNTAPVATPQSVTVAEDSTDNAITLAGTDADGDTISSFTVVTNPTHGTLGGTAPNVTYTPTADYNGTDSFTFKVNDGTEDSANATVSITVTSDGADIIHNGTEYGTVTSPYTHKVWLDRNLGAARVCTSYNDTACYGDYYQWGRNADGHEDGLSGTTDAQATAIDPVGHGDFIESNSTYDYDWAQAVDSNGSKRAAKWSQTDGSNVCPEGFRVPTIDELKAELLDAGSAQIDQNSTQKSGNSDDRRENAYNSFLKLPSAGYRSYDSAALYRQGSWGGLWAGSVVGSYAHYLYFRSGAAGWVYDYRAFGLSVRCLRD